MQSLSKHQKCFFAKNGEDDPQIHIEIQRTEKSQNNLEREEQNWRTHTHPISKLIMMLL